MNSLVPINVTLTDTDPCSRWTSLYRRPFRRCRRHSGWQREVVRCGPAHSTTSPVGSTSAAEWTAVFRPGRRNIRACLGRTRANRSRTTPACSYCLQFALQSYWDDTNAVWRMNAAMQSVALACISRHHRHSCSGGWGSMVQCTGSSTSGAPSSKAQRHHKNLANRTKLTKRKGMWLWTA